MGMAVLSAVRINYHPAHRVLDALLGMFMCVVLGMFVCDVPGMVVVRVRFVNCHDDPTLSSDTLQG